TSDTHSSADRLHASTVYFGTGRSVEAGITETEGERPCDLHELHSEPVFSRARKASSEARPPPTLAAAVVRRVQRHRPRGDTRAKIADDLNDVGVATAQRGGRWYPATVRHVLRQTGVAYRDARLLSAPRRLPS